MNNWKTLGFEKIKKTFSYLGKQQHLGHAYIFTGQDMIGKKTFAMELAAKLNNIDTSSYQHIIRHPDIFNIASQEEPLVAKAEGPEYSRRVTENKKETNKISINKIRDLKKFISLKPHSGPYKFAIIDNAHDLTPDAGNSILKTLEEPPPNSILILISSQVRQMLPTVVSRCEVIKFPPHSSSTLRTYFEKLNLNEKQINFLIQFSNGRIGLAIDLYENNSFSLIKKIIEDFQKLIQYPIYKRFDYISELLNNKYSYDSKTALLYWMLYLRSPLSDKIKISKTKILKELADLYYYLHQPQLNHKLIFENTLLNI